MLALLTSASTPPASCAASEIAARCRSSATSPGMAMTCVWFDSSARAFSRGSSPRASMIRVQPSSASLRASARPRPREAPVMIAVRCDDFPVISYASWSCLNTMYLSCRRREPSGGTVFGLYFGTGKTTSIDLSGLTSHVGGRSSGSVHEPAADGDPGRLGAVLGFELGKDGADVELDRPFGDKESPCDL